MNEITYGWSWKQKDLNNSYSNLFIQTTLGLFHFKCCHVCDICHCPLENWPSQGPYIKLVSFWTCLETQCQPESDHLKAWIIKNTILKCKHLAKKRDIRVTYSCVEVCMKLFGRLEKDGHFEGKGLLKGHSTSWLCWTADKLNKQSEQKDMPTPTGEKWQGMWESKKNASRLGRESWFCFEQLCTRRRKDVCWTASAYGLSQKQTIETTFAMKDRGKNVVWANSHLTRSHNSKIKNW